MQLKILSLLAAVLLCSAFYTKMPRSIRDYKKLTGPQWTGTLTYLDYGSGKRTTIKSNLIISQSGTDPHVFYRSYTYPDEPHANSRDTIVLSRDGKWIGAETIVKRNQVGRKGVWLVTEKNTTNVDGTRIVFRYTYQIGSNSVSIRKEERRFTDTAFIERNMYAFRRN